MRFHKFICQMIMITIWDHKTDPADWWTSNGLVTLWRSINVVMYSHNWKHTASTPALWHGMSLRAQLEYVDICQREMAAVDMLENDPNPTIWKCCGESINTRAEFVLARGATRHSAEELLGWEPPTITDQVLADAHDMVTGWLSKLQRSKRVGLI